MSAMRDTLEEFELPQVSACGAISAKSSGKSKDSSYDTGFAAGLEEGRKQQSSASQTIDAALQHAIQEMQVSRDAISHDCGRVVRCLVETLAPHLAQSGFAATAAKLIEDAARQNTSTISLHASANTLEILRSLCPEIARHGVELDADNSFTPMAARVSWKGGLSEIDFDAAIRQITDIVLQLDAAATTTGVE